MQTSCVAWKPVAQLSSVAPAAQVGRRSPFVVSGSQSAQSFVLVNGFVRVIILPRSRVSRSGNPNLVQFSARISPLRIFPPSPAVEVMYSSRSLWPRYRSSHSCPSQLGERLQLRFVLACSSFDFAPFWFFIFNWVFLLAFNDTRNDRNLSVAAGQSAEPAPQCCHAPNVQQLQVIVAPKTGAAAPTWAQSMSLLAIIKEHNRFRYGTNKRFQYFVSISLISWKYILLFL